MTRPKMNLLKVWMRAATAQEQETLAREAGTTRPMLYQVAGGHRNFSPEKAGEIERAAAVMAKASKGRLPALYRTDLSTACAKCSYARSCLGPIAERGDFPIVEDVFSEGRMDD